jgi:hypothetical protein
VHETRRKNYEEAADEYRVVLHSEAAEADTKAEGAAAWGPAILVDGYERLHAYLAFVHDGDISAVHVAMQCATWDDKGTTDPQWYDLYEDEAGTGVVVRKVYDFTATADIKVAWKIPRVARFMRFKVWTTGTDRADSRAILRASRVMESV